MPDVLRRRREPCEQPRPDAFGGELARGGGFGNADRELGIVGPLTRFPRPDAAADQGGLGGSGNVELIGRAECIPNGCADQGACDSIL